MIAGALKYTHTGHTDRTAVGSADGCTGIHMLRVQISRTKRVKTKRTSLPRLVSHNSEIYKKPLACGCVLGLILAFSIRNLRVHGPPRGIFECPGGVGGALFVRSQRNPVHREPRHAGDCPPAASMCLVGKFFLPHAPNDRQRSTAEHGWKAFDVICRLLCAHL